MNALTDHRSISSSPHASAKAMELAKIVTLVAPVSMKPEERLGWITQAVDSLVDISAAEIEHVSLEVQRSVTRLNQIVPKISDLVTERRARNSRAPAEHSQFAAERTINEESQKRRSKAHSQRQIEEAYVWERDARFDAGLATMAKHPPLSSTEIARLPAHIVSMGIKSGFLKRDGNRVAEVNDPDETDRIRETNRRVKSTA